MASTAADAGQLSLHNSIGPWQPMLGREWQPWNLCHRWHRWKMIFIKNMKGQTCENTAGTVEGFCTPWKSVCCTGLIFCRNKKSPQTSIDRFAFMRQLNFCFAFDLLFPLVPVSGKTAARPLLSQTAAKVTFLLALFLPFPRAGTCSLRISLDVFSLGRKEESGCENQLFTLLGPGLVDQGPLLCGEMREKTGFYSILCGIFDLKSILWPKLKT